MGVSGSEVGGLSGLGFAHEPEGSETTARGARSCWGARLRRSGTTRLTPELVDRVRSGRRGGEWVVPPEKALAMGMFYFLLLGWVEKSPPRRLLKVPVKR